MRSTAAIDLIPLPRLNSAELATFLLRLETEALAFTGEPSLGATKKHAASASKKRALPEPIGRGLRVVTEKRLALEEAAKAREGAVSSADPRRKAADTALDNAWRAFERWTDGWQQLEEGGDAAAARGEQASALHALVFGDGLTFITFDADAEFAESKKRLALMDEKKFVPFVESLGGAPFLATLRHCQKVFGDVWGITAPKKRAATSVDLRVVIVEAQNAAREYIAIVVGHAATGKEGAALADALLAPYAEASARTAKKGKGAAATPAAPPDPAK